MEKRLGLKSLRKNLNRVRFYFRIERHCTSEHRVVVVLNVYYAYTRPASMDRVCIEGTRIKEKQHTVDGDEACSRLKRR